MKIELTIEKIANGFLLELTLPTLRKESEKSEVELKGDVPRTLSLFSMFSSVYDKEHNQTEVRYRYIAKDENEVRAIITSALLQGEVSKC